ncbi:hypothetical protein BH23BAC4_BH23BAC4_15680 [soil metagenome]
MKISVIVPCYQAAEALAISLPAMRAQSIAAEWIFVDDGSSDSTAAVIEAELSLGFGAEGSSGSLIRLGPNQGRAAARNAGLGAASGDLIVFLDADAVPPETFLLNHLSVYTRHPIAVVAVSPIRPHESAPDDPYTTYLQLGRRGANKGSGRLHWQHFITTAASVRRMALDEVGAFDETIDYGEDTDLALRLEVRFPVGLRAASAEIGLLQTGDIEVALGKMRHFASETLPNLAKRHPQIERWPGFRVVLSRPPHRPVQAVPRLIAGSALVAAIARRLLPKLPQTLAPRVVRLLLAHALVTGYDGRSRA